MVETKIVRTRSEKSELIYDIHEFCINADTRELFLHSYIDDSEESGVDYRMASRFEKNLRILTALNDNPILIHMHTIGGNWYDGMAIYDTIKGNPLHITILAYANARSMSSIILQAADYRIMMPHTCFMIHEGSDGYDGTHRGFITHAEEAKLAAETMLNIYTEKCSNGEKLKGKTNRAIKTFLQSKMDKQQEWYLTARDSVKYGFADAVLGDEGCENIKKLLE